VGRGFEPMPTWSAHWLADPRFTAAVKDYLAHEHGAMQEYMDELKGHLPYKHDDR
jgi:predicted N-acyltransferase